jgi:hypothetical protein
MDLAGGLRAGRLMLGFELLFVFCCQEGKMAGPKRGILCLHQPEMAQKPAYAK